MEKNNKTLLIAVLIMLLALVSLNFNSISGRVGGSGDNQHPLSLTAVSRCNEGQQASGTLGGNFRSVSHDKEVTIRLDTMNGPIVGRDNVGTSNTVQGNFGEAIGWTCEEGTHTYYAIMRSRSGDHVDYGTAIVSGN